MFFAHVSGHSLILKNHVFRSFFVGDEVVEHRPGHDGGPVDRQGALPVLNRFQHVAAHRNEGEYLYIKETRHI